MNDDKARISVVGGGIGGLTAALFLRRGGHQIRVFEQSPTLAEVGAGITLWPNAVRVLSVLGLEPALRAAGRYGDSAYIGTAAGRFLSQVSLPDSGVPAQMRLLGIHRARLQQILYDALPEGSVRLGWACTGFDQDDDGVTLRFDGQLEQHSDLVVGADGIDSVVRRQLIGDEPPRYSGYTAYRGLLTDWPERPAISGEFWGRGQRFGIVPIGDRLLYWFATANQAPERILPQTTRKRHLLEGFAGWAFGIPDILERTPPDAILQHDIVDRPPMRGWSQGRVVLIGDAAHPTTPNMGQGAAMAIEDAPILQWALEQDPDPHRAFETFERTRAPRTSRITNTSWRIGKVGQWRRPLVCAMRDRVVALTPTSVQTRAALQMVGYDATSVPVIDG